MATKREVLADPNSCLNKAGDDEPIFVLRAKDIVAPATVRFWHDLAAEHNAHEPAKRRQAWLESYDMDTWRKENVK
jgi:hypothetical protein